MLFLDDAIRKHVVEICSTTVIPDEPMLVATDNIGEIVEKLIILHIRMWMLEDTMQSATTDSAVAAIKRKCDVCFKQKRPKLVEALNVLFNNAARTGASLLEENVKQYKG